MMLLRWPFCCDAGCSSGIWQPFCGVLTDECLPFSPMNQLAFPIYSLCMWCKTAAKYSTNPPQLIKHSCLLLRSVAQVSVTPISSREDPLLPAGTLESFWVAQEMSPLPPLACLIFQMFFLSTRLRLTADVFVYRRLRRLTTLLCRRNSQERLAAPER